MKTTIITIGDEILIGQVVDTNSAWIGNKLSEIGIDVHHKISIGDDHDQIVKTLSSAGTELILLTGGLGPTKDDITKKAIADYLGVDMYFDEGTYDRISRIFEKLQRPISESHKDQCLMPQSVRLLKNSMGTAPGMYFEHEGKIIISMPGVPYEMQAIMEEEVLPILKNLSNIEIIHKTILTSGEGETTIEDKISDIVTTFPNEIKIAYLPGLGQVRLRLTCKYLKSENKSHLIEEYTKKVADRVGEIVYGFDNTNIETEILKICVAKNIKISTAESCTGGALAAKLVSVPGSSSYFSGGIIAYSNEIKQNLLAVSLTTLTNHGAVSEETVKEMVDGALKILNTDVAISVSGIAGPDGGTKSKPVGTIWLCVGNKDTKKSHLLKAGKNRQKNIEMATNVGLSLLLKFIKNL